MKSSGMKMKDQFKINPIGSEVSSLKKNKSKVSKICFIWFFAGIASVSLSLVIVFWHTNVFRDMILSGLELKNGTQTFTWWETPPVRPLLRVRLFNYTNVEEYESGNASKLHVEEIGPYIYRETLIKVNATFNGNGTLSYREKTSHEWVGGSAETDIIKVPNIPLIMALKEIERSTGWWQLPYAVGLNYMAPKAFKQLTVKEYLWGYSDDLVSVGANIQALFETLPYDKFGMLIARDGLSKDLLTVNTGAGDINNLGTYQRINGVKSRNVWGDEECDKIDGTDGSMFPPNLVRDKNSSLNIYAREMCRQLPLRYHGIGSASDIPTLRYKLSKDVFTSSETSNSCFCKKTIGNDGEKKITCPPSGTFDISRCSYGVPLLISFPHFYNGDKELLNHVDGLNPRQELHETYADLHPRLGLLIGGWSRFQVNVRVAVPAVVVSALDCIKPLKEGMILPAIWFEIGVDVMPENLLTTLQQAYYTVNTIESSLQWGSLLCTILSMCAMAYMMKKPKKIVNPKWQNNFSLQT